MVKEGGGCPVLGCTEKQESHPHMAHDGDWEQKVSSLSLMELGGYPPEPDVPMTMAPFKLGPPPSFWVGIGELGRCGYDFGRRKPFVLIRSQGLYYEVQGYDPKRKQYWIELIDPAWRLRGEDIGPVLVDEPDLEGRLCAVSKDREPPAP
jgi:hypothetical protein